MSLGASFEKAIASNKATWKKARTAQGSEGPVDVQSPVGEYKCAVDISYTETPKSEKVCGFLTFNAVVLDGDHAGEQNKQKCFLPAEGAPVEKKVSYFEGLTKDLKRMCPSQAQKIEEMDHEELCDFLQELTDQEIECDCRVYENRKKEKGVSLSNFVQGGGSAPASEEDDDDEEGDNENTIGVGDTCMFGSRQVKVLGIHEDGETIDIKILSGKGKGDEKTVEIDDLEIQF